MERDRQSVGPATGDQPGPDVVADVASHVHHDHVHHYFRLGLVEIVQQLFHQRHFIHRVAHHDRILRVELEHPAHIRHGSHGRYDFRKLLCGGGIFQVENLYHFVFIVAALRNVVFRHKNGVAADRLPKCLGQQRDVIQSFLQGDVVQIQVGILTRLDLRIEEHIDSRQLAHGFIEHLGRLIVHLEQADLVSYRLQLGHGLQRSDHLQTVFLRLLSRCQRLFTGRDQSFFLLFHQLLGPLHVLQRDHRSRIHGERLLKLSLGLLNLARFFELVPSLHVRRSRFETRPASGQLVSSLLGIFLQGLLKVFQGLVELLMSFGVGTQFQKLVAFAGARFQAAGEECQTHDAEQREDS